MLSHTHGKISVVARLCNDLERLQLDVADAEALARHDRDEGDRATEEDGEQIERDGAQHHLVGEQQEVGEAAEGGGEGDPHQDELEGVGAPHHETEAEHDEVAEQGPHAGPEQVTVGGFDAEIGQPYHQGEHGAGSLPSFIGRYRQFRKTYGLAGAPSGESLSRLITSNDIHLNGARLESEENIRLLAGHNNNLVADAETRLWNKTVIPINSVPDAHGEIRQDNRINIAAYSADLTGISLRQRAWPMIEMFRRCHAAGEVVVWGV